MKYLLIIIALTTTPVFGYAKGTKKNTSTQTQAKAAAPVAPIPLWTAWYTVIVGGQHHGYYKEEAEDRPQEKHVAINQHWWEQNPPLGQSESMIGAVGVKGSIAPHAFYVEKKTELGSTIFEGRSKDRKVNVTIHPSKEKLTIKLKKNTILSSQLALLIAEHKRKGNSKPVDFSALVEDPVDKKFEIKIGRFQITKEKKTIRGDDCFLAETMMENIAGQWWINSKGKVCMILLPALGAKIELADEAEAKGFLK